MKRISKKFMAMLLVMIIILPLLVGCNEENQNVNDVEIGKDEDKPVEIVDMAGEKVVISGKVEKVFSTGAVGTILLYSLNPDKMVGWNYDLRDGEKEFVLEKYHDLPNLGGAGKESINIEEMLKVDPDVLIVMESIDDNIILEVKELEKTLEKPIVILDSDIHKIDEAYEVLGKVLGEEERAKDLAEYCRNTLEDVEEKSAKIEEDMKVNVYYAEGPEGLETEPAGSWHAEILDMVGGNNIAKTTVKEDKGKSQISIEQLLSWNPDLIISWDDERGGYYSEIFKDPAWKDIRAVKREEVYEIPNKPFNWLDRPPSVNRILGLKWAGNLIYPEIYDYNMRDEVEEFYEKFYHYQLTEDQIDKLLQNSTRQ